MNSSETQDDFSNIVDYVRDTGKAYWTEGFSFYLYGLIKMIKPKMVVEFGTGYGTTCFLAAQACKENNFGKVISIDDGSDWNENCKYQDFLSEKISEYRLSNFLNIENYKINFNNLASLNHLDEVNIVFNDIDCSPYCFFAILKWLIPRTKTASYFIIDRGATYWPNYCAMELSIEQLNSGKIPKVLYDIIDNKPQFQELIKRFKFSTQYVLKTVNQGSDQDSFAVLKIEDYNIGYF
jgi:hypothetical protein